MDDATKRTLVAMARALYPHDFLEDAVYEGVIDRVLPGLDAGGLALAEEGAQALDAATEGGFAALAADDKEAALKAIEETPFFATMRAAVVRQLYNHRAIWPRFGYEGPSAHLGGYIERGFDDISWIRDE